MKLSLAGEQQEQELWVAVINKKTNEPYKTIFNCSSIPRFEKEEPELAKKLIDSFNEWMKNDANKQLLKWDSNNRDGCGFKFVDGEWEYKLLEFTKDGKSWRTLGKRKLSKGGAGGYGKTYTLLRTSQVRFVRKEGLADIINNQTDTENYEITYVGSDAEGQEFMVEKKDVYVPQLVTTKQDGNTNESKEENSNTEQAQE